MLEPIFSFFERLISDFSWRRLLFVITALGVLLAAFWIYESYTGASQLARIEKEVALLERLSRLSEHEEVKNDGELHGIYTDLQSKLSHIVAPNDSPIAVSAPVKKSLAAAAAWFVLAFILILAGRSVPESEFTSATAAGILIFAIPFIVLAAFIPTFRASWINYFVYPVGHVALVVVIVLVWHRRRRRRAA